MNELKPEDVMRALAWYEVVCKNIGSVTVPSNELQAIAALLREKDALIEDYRQELGRTRVALNDARRDCAVSEQNHYECKKELEEMSDDILDSVRAERDRYKAESKQYQSAMLEKDAEIERLKNSITFQVVMPDEKMESIKAECLKRVDELGNQRWISVKDRFPEPYEGVLVWGKDTGGVRWGMYSPYHSIWKDGTISHWMQLPEPPETKDDFPNCKISGCEAARKDCHIDCPYGKENSHGSK